VEKQIKQSPPPLLPFFFLHAEMHPGLPYATSALRLLLRDPSTPPGDADALRKVSANLHKKSLAMFQDNGLFQPMGVLEYFSSPGYVNPLAGLALLPLLEEYDGTKVNPSLGILEGHPAVKGILEEKKSRPRNEHF
jgi:hypothetical protein